MLKKTSLRLSLLVAVLLLLAGLITWQVVRTDSADPIVIPDDSNNGRPAVEIRDPFVFSDDATRGKLAAENSVMRVVWHYKTTREENNNRGGGSIYELYDKRTDPGARRNMVAALNKGGGNSSPNMPGIGGLGATHVWTLGVTPADSDVGKWGQLESTNYFLDPDGNAVFDATFTVKNNADDQGGDPDNYRVHKLWTVYPDGRIKLDISMEFLRNYYASEPAYDFSFSRDYGWTTASSLGHGWSASKCQGAGSNGYQNPNNFEKVIPDINSGTDHDYEVLHTQSFDLYGSAGGDRVRVRMDNEGKGFEGGGLFNLGQTIWGNTTNPTAEFSSYSQRAYGHTLRFFAWWGGSPPPEERHQLVTAGTSWSDSLWIEMFPAAAAPGPETS